jgi:signal transduction histidine kinase
MELAPQNIRLVKRAYWLIKLRWIAIAGVGLAAFLARLVLQISVQDYALYAIAILLALYNMTALLLLNHFTRKRKEAPRPAIKKLINFQMSADLLILTVLLHFSGGIENPFVFFFIFHMVIASILLSVRESYLQATFAILLFGLLVLLEYVQLIPHYCLTGFVAHCLRQDSLYVLGTFLVFATTLYLVVYMASHIAARLRRANIQLRQKDRIKDEYVLRVTHDIKGHLATVQSCLGVVSNGIIGPLDEQQAELINRAHARTAKLTNFVKTLLKLTQMRLSNELEMYVFSLGDAIHKAVATVKTKAEGKSITLNCNIEPSADRIFGNQFSIEEMVTNLLLNAIKYTPAKGTIDMSAKNNGDCVLVEITDTGIGIPQEEQHRIFDEFYRATKIVKYIVERHGGQIGVESKENNGTKFWFKLPKGTS